MLHFKVFKVINQNGIEEKLENLKLNEQVSISDLKKSESLKITSSSGDTYSFGEIVNILFYGVCIIKTQSHTLIFDYV